ncbi:MAG: transcription-repair coupling factor [Candidatus Phlomobacter fragariae]
MPAKYYYQLPKQQGDTRHLGCLISAAAAVECADIVQRHPGLVVLITQDTHNALKLRDEIQQFSQNSVTIFSDWETLPYDNFSPHQEIISERLANLYRLPTLTKGLLILPVNTLMQKVCPADFLTSNALVIHKGDKLSREKLRNNLDKAGYRHVEQVLERVEYATRGALLDLFPMGSDYPYRIDFFDDEIDSLRTFDVDSQLTVSEVAQINLLPAHEFPTDDKAIELFRSQWREHFDVRRNPEHIYQQISKRVLPAGIEYWQPLFFNHRLSSLFDYFPANTLLITQDLATAADRFWADTYQRYESRCVDPMRPLLPPDTLWLNSEQLNQDLKTWPRIKISVEPVAKKAGNTNLPYLALPDLSISHQNKAPLDKLHQFIKNFTGRIIFSAESAGRRETVQDLLTRIKINPSFIKTLNEAYKPGFYITVGAAERGFTNQDQQIALICESDILGERIIQRDTEQRKTINTDILIRNLAELRPGQPVVHLEHGVGRYQGLTTLEAGGIQAEYLMLTYAGNDKLYVPVLSLNLISRYSGASDESAPLHKLGGDVWTKAKQKASEKIRDIAAELLDIHAQRSIKPGFAFKHDKMQYQLFCQGFPFETTTDQEQAINSVLSDMCQPIAMDRLVCGDVGFGKTEVAMRAAFMAITNNQQVAVLVPTTLLAQQHFDNFRDRFADWPVRIEMLSRFRSAKEQQQIINTAAEGKVDILIGTHKLLKNDIRWKALGLLIVDEEHRFGVRHKELIKSMRANIDILTLTATPIPRTLNMAVSGMRDLSIIATPPSRRLSVKTFVRQYDDSTVREAILREILRGGQVYYLFNDVKYIEKTKERLESLVPEARFVIGHGQMRERELERVMTDFHRLRFNVLICTTIIETGIDIPSANTIIIERADHFGLAQLHQLRGRVGRSYHQAYAYLLTPHPKTLTVDAQKRLKAIVALEDLGSGFGLATHDLEIRGAGELLGEEQSGQMTTIGFTLYMKVLENTVEALKQGKEPSLEELTSQQTEIELRMPVLLPDDYIPDVNLRLSFYKRIVSAKHENELDELKIELIDRFGKLPDAGKQLLQSTAIRMHTQALGIKRIEAHEKGGFIEFNEQNRVNATFLIALLQNSPDIYRLDGPNKLKFVKSLINYAERLTFVKQLIADFQSHQI